jgi:hypothetical protein
VTIDAAAATPDDAGPDDTVFTPSAGATALRPALVDVVRVDPWTFVRGGLVAAYLVGYVWFFFAKGLIIDRISVFVSVVILLALTHVGRPLWQWVRLARDVALYAAMWTIYEESRGIADRVGMPLQVESVRNIDRAIFLGTDPSVWLQDNFLRDDVRWYDIVGSIAYYTHFVVPIVVIVVLWIGYRRDWARYMRRFASLLFVACLGFIFFPTAPPWMAGGGKNAYGYRFDALPPLRRPTGRGWQELGLHGFVRAWETGRDWANQVAAMPSLHAGFAAFIVAYFWSRIRSPWVRGALLLYPFTMTIALVYFAEHYVSDALVSFVIIAAVFAAWTRLERAVRRRRADRLRDALGVPIPDRTERAAWEPRSHCVTEVVVAGDFLRALTHPGSPQHEAAIDAFRPLLDRYERGDVALVAVRRSVPRAWEGAMRGVVERIPTDRNMRRRVALRLDGRAGPTDHDLGPALVIMHDRRIRTIASFEPWLDGIDVDRVTTGAGIVHTEFAEGYVHFTAG